MPRSGFHRVALAGMIGAVALGWTGTVSLAAQEMGDHAPQLVLRIDTQEYLFPFDRIGIETPPFSAYADGRVIYRGNGGFFEIHLDQDALAELLEWAATAGGLGEAADRYAGEIYDAGTTSFFIKTDDLSREIDAYGFGLPAEYLRDVTPEEAEAYERMLALFDRLVISDDFIPNDARPTSYEPEAYTAYLLEEDGRQDPAYSNWPWPELGFADLREAGVSGFAPLWTLRLTAEQADRLRDRTFVVDADGRHFDLTLSPLLPDQTSGPEVPPRD